MTRWTRKPIPALCRDWEEAKYWRICEMHDDVFQKLKEADEVLNKLFDVDSASNEVDEIIDLIDDDMTRACNALDIIEHEIAYAKRRKRESEEENE